MSQYILAEVLFLPLSTYGVRSLLENTHIVCIIVARLENSYCSFIRIVFWKMLSVVLALCGDWRIISYDKMITSYQKLITCESICQKHTFNDHYLSHQYHILCAYDMTGHVHSLSHPLSYSLIDPLPTLHSLTLT